MHILLYSKTLQRQTNADEQSMDEVIYYVFHAVDMLLS